MINVYELNTEGYYDKTAEVPNFEITCDRCGGKGGLVTDPHDKRLIMLCENCEIIIQITKP